MTCIIAVTDGHNVWMGADSAGVDASGNVYLKTDPKVWHADDAHDIVIGAAGSQRLRQALQCLFEPPPFQEDSSYDHMIGIFIPRLRDCLRADGQLLTKDGREHMDGHLLVGIRCGIYMVDTHFGITELRESYAAIGSGAPEARGALFALDYHTGRYTPHMRIERALEASYHFNADIRGPFTIISTCEKQG